MKERNLVVESSGFITINRFCWRKGRGCGNDILKCNRGGWWPSPVIFTSSQAGAGK